MVKQIAWVLGGGGSRGALQVGAIQALLESGIQPDLLVGTSIGAVNAAFLALHGINSQGLAGLVDAWHDAMHAELLPSNYLWLTLRTLFNRPVEAPIHRMRDFFISHGLAPDLKFGDIDHVPLIVVAADLNASCPVHYGMNPNDRVLDGLLASTALPPWIHPLQMEDRLLMDGGVISNLPIEPALTYGAKEIIALSLMDFRDVATGAQGFGPFVGKVFSIVQQRQVTLELALAEATGAKIHRIDLLGRDHIPLWDFEYTDELIARGYEIMQGKLAAGMLDSLIRKDGWLKRVKRVLRIGTRDK